MHQGLLASIMSSMPIEFLVEYLVIAGAGGGDGSDVLDDIPGAGGGSGGYRCSVVGEYSGASSLAEEILSILKDESLLITIGSGGTGGNYATNGSNSVLGDITSIGGGAGGGWRNNPADPGGSGGGGYNTSGAAGTANQGCAGGPGDTNTSGQGGSAAQNGSKSSASVNPGLTSSITGTAVRRADGGRGGSRGTEGHGSGAANTGSGGYGGCDEQGARNGGSGIVIIRYPDSMPDIETIGAGLTYTKTVAGGYKIYAFTAGTDTITF